MPPEKGALLLDRRKALIGLGAATVGTLVAAATGTVPNARADAVPPGDPRLRFVDISGAFNVRDVGGWTVGRHRALTKGVVYRGSSLGRVNEIGLAQLTALGLAVDIDFLSDRERAVARPDVLPAGVRTLSAPVGDDPGTDTSGSFDTTQPDQGVLTEFRSYVLGPQARASFGRTLRELAGLRGRPFYLHCNSGTYRTGWATALLMTVLGVDRDQIDQEFLLSNLTFGVSYAWTEYLDAAYQQAETTYGSFHRYLLHGLGVRPEHVQRLRRNLIT